MTRFHAVIVIIYYQIDFMLELADTTKPKVLCSCCRSRLANLETGRLTTEKWEKDRAKIEILQNGKPLQCLSGQCIVTQ